MKSAVDTSGLAALLAARLGAASVGLEPIDVACAWPVYRATCAGRGAAFVKLTAREAAMRTAEFLTSCECPFLPKPVLDDVPDFGGLAVLCLEWKASTRVDAEAMTDAQLDGFLAGCKELAAAFGRYRGTVAAPAEEDSPLVQHERLRRYALRHPIAGRLLKPLLAIPEGERTYGSRPLATVHGDLQPKNYGFDGDRLAAVYDTDDLTKGLACEDACYAFTERARRLELSASARRRIEELFARFVSRSPWPRDEWLIAVNHARLRIAARRLEKRPDSVFVAFDIARRDKPLGRLARVLKEASC